MMTVKLNEDVKWNSRVVTNASWRNEEETAKEMTLELCLKGEDHFALIQYRKRLVDAFSIPQETVVLLSIVTSSLESHNRVTISLLSIGGGWKGNMARA